MSSLCSVCNSYPCPGCTGAALDEIARLKARNKADRHARADAAETQDRFVEEAMAQTLVVLLFVRNDGRWTAKQRAAIEAAIAKCTRVAAPNQVEHVRPASQQTPKTRGVKDR